MHAPQPLTNSLGSSGRHTPPRPSHSLSLPSPFQSVTSQPCPPSTTLHTPCKGVNLSVSLLPSTSPSGSARAPPPEVLPPGPWHRPAPSHQPGPGVSRPETTTPCPPAPPTSTTRRPALLLGHAHAPPLRPRPPRRPPIGSHSASPVRCPRRPASPSRSLVLAIRAAQPASRTPRSL